MITKTYICDKCRSSVGQHELYPIKVEIKVPNSNNSFMRTAAADKEICSACLEKAGILTKPPEGRTSLPDAQIAENSKTLEAKIIDFLQDIGVVFES